ncbi:CD59 glycoprotein-like [Glandiceps talaboti]
MRSSLELLVVLSLLTTVCISLRCYECSGESSNSKCNRDEDLVNCSRTQDACLKTVVWSTVDGKTIHKSCYWASECDTALQTTWPCDTLQNAWACSECCDTDDCNISDTSLATTVTSSKFGTVISFVLFVIMYCKKTS